MKEGAKALGLDLFGEGLEDNWTVTAIRAPEGIDADTISDTIRADFGVVLAPGQGPLKGKVFRIGHFGYFSELDIMRGLGGAGDDAWRRSGYPVKRGAAVAAAEDVFIGSRRLPSVRVLVTEKLSEQGLELLRKDFEVDVRPELAGRRPRRRDRAVRRADRPHRQTQVTDEVLAAAPSS